MDNSCSESDISMSPSQILERLQILRQLQLMQRGKLQKQRLQYQETTESSSCITEMVSHFTNSATSTSYNTFRSLLNSSQNVIDDCSPLHSASNTISPKVHEKDLVDGISVLNLSQESEFIINTPVSGRSRASGNSNSLPKESFKSNENEIFEQNKINKKNCIALDEMPILTPKKDFEGLLVEKLEKEKTAVSTTTHRTDTSKPKKHFLRRGEGMARFGVKKNDLVIMNTNSLPWKRNAKLKSSKPVPVKQHPTNHREKTDVEIIVPPLNLNSNHKSESKIIQKHNKDVDNSNRSNISSVITSISNPSDNNDTPKCCDNPNPTIPEIIIQKPKGKHPVLGKKGKTWASILTSEQSDFLMQLKQSEYYKNFASPTKSTVSDMSCDETTAKLRQEKETAEQNLFELLENKVTHESFNVNTSFFNRLLRRNQLECSGESTPIVMHKCLVENPNLMHIFPNNNKLKNNSYNDVDTCQSDYTECCSDACSSISSCCSCKTVEPATPQPCKKDIQNKVPNKNSKKEVRIETNQPDNCQDEVDKEQEAMKANMEEMNSKLITTSELLKERLHELEDEIETFRKENMNLNKMKEEVDIERQKFYEEKNSFEQKFNEEKILSEYYLAEEKDKLNKQKQMYERYVREMRGRLNKKEKDEVVNLRQEINNLKDEIRIKDAKSTSTIARLRNQLKIIEKEKTDLQSEVEKLKKENRRIQHSNDITRRLTNMKYLEQINKKLSDMHKENKTEIEPCNDAKYKAFEIERQSRTRRVDKTNKTATRPRAKSVPNLKVTSRYAKYFSQRDVFTPKDRPSNITSNQDILDAYSSDDVSDNEIENADFQFENVECDNENKLERIYMDTFRSGSPKSSRSKTNQSDNCLTEHSANNFFLRKSNSTSSRSSKSPVNTSPLYSMEKKSENRSKSPISYSNSTNKKSEFRSKSPISILSNKSSRSPIDSQTSPNHSIESNQSHTSKSVFSMSNPSSLRSATVIHKDMYQDKLMTVSPEPSNSRTSMTKTNLNPTEYKKPDGSKELRFPNGNVKHISADGKYCKFVYYNGDVKENFYNEGRIKYFYAESKTYHTTHPDGLEVLEFPDGQVEKRYKDGSSEVRLPNGCVRYQDPKNEHVREEWRYPDGSALTVAANGEKRIVFPSGQVEVHANDHKRREFPDGTVKLVYNDGTSETRYASGRVRIKDKHGNLIMDSAPR